MKLLRLITAVSFVLVISSSCRSEREKYYERPAWLEGTLYQQLKATGKYSEYLKWLDLTGYGEIFDRGGSYTLFVPTNGAFEEFYAANSYSGAQDVPEELRKEVVEFLTLNYSYSKSLLLDWSSFDLKWTHDSRAFKKRTLLKRYERLSDNTMLASEYKYIPLFSDEYFSFRTGFISGIAYDESCYEYFYPGTPWTGMNLAEATFIEVEQPAENGFYYVIDKVVLPIDNIAESVYADARLSKFASIIKKFEVYTESADETELLGGTETVYKRNYNFNGNLYAEDIMVRDHSGFNMYGIAVPVDAAFEEYVNSVILAGGYTSLADVSDVTLQYIVNAHIKLPMTNATYYPIDLSLETGDFGKIDYNNPSQVVFRKYASNGLIYGINTVIESDVLKSVARKPFFDPDFKMFLRLLDKSGNLSVMGVDEYTIVGVKDDVWTALGYTYNDEQDIFIKDNTVVTDDEIRAVANNQIFVNSCDATVAGGNYGKSLGGNYVAFEDGKVSGSDASVELKGRTEGSNGFFYYADTPLPVINQPTLDSRLSDAALSGFKSLFTIAGYTVSSLITSISANEHVVFAPSNEAIQTAIDEGKLPAGPDYTAEDKAAVLKAIRNHVVPVDLLFTTMPFATRMLNTMAGESITLSNSDGQAISVTKGTVTASTVTDNVNLLATGSWVIHTIDKVLID